MNRSWERLPLTWDGSLLYRHRHNGDLVMEDAGTGALLDLPHDAAAAIRRLLEEGAGRGAR